MCKTTSLIMDLIKTDRVVVPEELTHDFIKEADERGVRFFWEVGEEGEQVAFYTMFQFKSSKT
jgi:hypothetical protein